MLRQWSYIANSNTILNFSNTAKLISVFFYCLGIKWVFELQFNKMSLKI